MRKLCCLILLLLAGCQSTVGPFQARPGNRPDDPNYSIAEQQMRQRDRFALPDDFSGMAPKTGAAIPGSGFSAR